MSWLQAKAEKLEAAQEHLLLHPPDQINGDPASQGSTLDPFHAFVTEAVSPVTTVEGQTITNLNDLHLY